jgi:hypothetical protein
MTIADVDGDGRMDLVVLDGTRSDSSTEAKESGFGRSPLRAPRGT